MGMASLLNAPPERRIKGKGRKLRAGREKRLNKKIPPHSKKSKRSAQARRALAADFKSLANALTYGPVFIILFVK